MPKRHGGQILVDQLKIHGVDRVFCIPGESFLAALDGLYESGIDTVVSRQEGGATMMAEAHGVLTGQPGIAFVTRGPGATNGSSGIHVAHQDSTPLIVFVGQVGTDMMDREAFQEIDYRRMFGEMTKWVAQIDRTERIPEYVSHAFHVAMSGRPGPVVLALPEDMLSAEAEVADGRHATPVGASASPADLNAIGDRLARSTQPLVIVGGGGWTAQSSADLQTFAEKWSLPVAAGFRCQDYFDNTNANYAGDVGIGINPKLGERVRETDCLLVIGSRLGEMTTSGYTLLDIPVPRQPLIHVHPGADELGRVYRPDLAVNSASPAILAALADLPAPQSVPWGAWTEAAHSDYLAWTEPQETPGAVKLEQVVAHLRRTLPADAIVTNGAGNYTAWVHRYYRYRSYGSQLAPTSGSMGYGLPAAVAAKLAYPGRTVVCFAGDGCFQMTCQEFGTAAQQGANIVVIVCNNGMYGTIRMHQEREYPGRVSATRLDNPDFAAFARAYGGHGAVVERTEDFPAAFDAALTANAPAIIELRLDPEALTPKMRLANV